MTTKPITAARLSEIAALCDKATSLDYSRSVDRECIAAIPELLAEVARLQSAVSRLANNERDLAETHLALEQRDRDLTTANARIAALEAGLREAGSTSATATSSRPT